MPRTFFVRVVLSRFTIQVASIFPAYEGVFSGNINPVTPLGGGGEGFESYGGKDMLVYDIISQYGHGMIHNYTYFTLT